MVDRWEVSTINLNPVTHWTAEVSGNVSLCTTVAFSACVTWHAVKINFPRNNHNTVTCAYQKYKNFELLHIPFD